VPLVAGDAGAGRRNGYTDEVSGSRLVYSTDGGTAERFRPERPPGGRGGRARPSGPGIPQAPDDGWLRLWRVKGGRGGKTATVVTGVTAADLESLAVELRRAVGAGGGVRDGAIEIQGDHRERLAQRLTALGYKVKLAGG
jgi:translation initiation factor 1